jgi:vancomycin permeability regulator SanA
MLKNKIFNKISFPKLLKSLLVLFLMVSIPFFTFSIQAFGFEKKDVNSKIALILGAGVRSDGEPSWILKSRLDTGLELYKSGKVKIVIVSGDNRFEYYNEPKAMREYLLAAGVPKSDIVEDFAGRRTFDSCWRAKNVFKAKSVTVVTQAFHTPRSVFLCESVGLSTDYAVASDAFLSTTANGTIREVPSSFLAIFECVFEKTAQVKGDGSERDLSQI